MSKRLTRAREERMIAGVAVGIARYFEVDPTLVRIGFLLLLLPGGLSPVLYLVLWLVIPLEADAAR